MATILIIRMLQQMREYHAKIGTNLTDHNDNLIEPLPFIMF